jgi:hypothetical protein
MTQNFVMAFGGTGARCVEALTYLAASNAVQAPLHLLIVDPDETNGNVGEALKQLRRYHTIQEQVRPSTDAETPPFFSTRLNTDLGSDSYFWANPSPNVEFGSLINYAAHDADARALLDLLYDKEDMRLTFEKGYIGRAHIGSLDLMRTLRDQITTAAADERDRPDSMLQFFRKLRAATQQPGGARLIVFGSVFGGTGASGLPAVPPLLRSVLLSGLQRDLSIACVQVTPYFSFPPGGEEDPDSALHPLATQAALYHYSLTDTGYDRIYLVGAPGREQSNRNNVVGGDAQRNMAHYVELAAALAAAHFFAAPPPAGGAEVMACGAEEVRWDKLPFEKESDLRRRLVSFGTFCLMHARFLGPEMQERRHIGSRWMDVLTAREGRRLGGQEGVLRDLQDFSERALTWARELQRIDGVDLFALPEQQSEQALASVARGGTSRKPYHEIYSRLTATPDLKQQETGPGWYIEALTKASTQYSDSIYQGWGRS